MIICVYMCICIIYYIHMGEHSPTTPHGYGSVCSPCSGGAAGGGGLASISSTITGTITTT